MKYSVEQLDAMPVGTVLFTKDHMLIKLSEGNQPWQRMTPQRYSGKQYWQDNGRLSNGQASRPNFTHRAAPTPITEEQNGTAE